MYVRVCVCCMCMTLAITGVVGRAFEKEQREAFSRLCNKAHKERGLIFRYVVIYP